MMEGRMQVAANWVWVYLMVAVCIHDIPPSPTLPPVHHTVHIYILNTGKHTRKGCAYTNIDDASQDTGKGVCVQLSRHLRARVVYTVDTPTSLYR